MNRIQSLTELGQSIWLDYIRRDMTRNGDLARMIADGLRGMTSNPAIFQKSISSSPDYADAIAEEGRDPDLSPKALYEKIAIVDIQDACDAMKPLYERTNRSDGFVSLEVAPDLAADRDGTLAEAQRLWATVARPNLMIKVPGTPAGIDATETLIAAGISVNVTLIFSCASYRKVAQAYRRGLERRLADGLPISEVASVASFFISRIDSAVDQRLERIAAEGPAAHRDRAASLLGQIAIANAKVAYAIFGDDIASEGWAALAAAGARPQRLLWASTGTKNPRYSDTLYVDALIGRDTVNTVPPATLDAFVDHGHVEATLSEGLDEARRQLEDLAAVGISLDEVTDELLTDGLKLFSDAMESLLRTVATEQKRLRDAG